jgi:SNF2 family DNA or RNA helicase
VRDLQEGKLRGVACTIKAAGLGLTMTKAHDCLFIDREWTNAENIQAEDRMCRIGQKEVVQVTNLVANHPLDERVAELLEYKRQLAEPMTWPNVPTREVPVADLQRIVEMLP